VNQADRATIGPAGIVTARANVDRSGTPLHDGRGGFDYCAALLCGFHPSCARPF